jgi:hypothetical protein
MKPVRMLLIAAVLASAASGVQAADPHWTAAIGTGRVSEGGQRAVRNVPAPSELNQASTTSQPHWTARIGTGNAARSGEKSRTFGRLEAARACSCSVP